MLFCLIFKFVTLPQLRSHNDWSGTSNTAIVYKMEKERKLSTSLSGSLSSSPSGMFRVKPNDASIFESVTFFQNLEPELLQTLLNELSTRVYNDNAYIIKKGETGRAMFFIVKGTVEVVSEDGMFFKLG